MQEVQEKFTFPTKEQALFCGICITDRSAYILLYEVRNHERRGKTASALGSGGSQTTGDPFRTSGKPNPQCNAVKYRLPAWAGGQCRDCYTGNQPVPLGLPDTKTG